MEQSHQTINIHHSSVCVQLKVLNNLIIVSNYLRAVLGPSIETKRRRFTYAQVLAMTNNNERVLGKGGFGMVYHGYINGTEEVAVKQLSPSSAQGYKEFKTEVFFNQTIITFALLKENNPFCNV